MTAGNSSNRPQPVHNEAARQYYEHSKAPRVNTDIVVVEALRKEYPELHLAVSPAHSCDLRAYAAAGHAALAPIDKEQDRLTWRVFYQAASRLSGERGVLADQTKFVKYLLDWQGKEFIVVIVDGRDGEQPYPVIVNQYILSASVEATNKLLFEAGVYGSSLHGEIWVFDGGFWQKSSELWKSAMKASWNDVILDEKMKQSIIADSTNFFDARERYHQLGVPWKRGIIYHGPPGNGKTISIKAMMHQLYNRKEDPIPTLYVKTLASFGGPEYSIRLIFEKCRQVAPCLLVLEDLDSFVTDSVRSYFLNAIDGIQSNDGILMVGSTNYLDRLDPGIAKRPSRFDRKYKFPNPNTEERILYMNFWQRKLEDNKDIEFPDLLCPAIAKITHGFSFAYLQEAMVASLLAIARETKDCNDQTCLECMETHEKPSNGTRCDRDGRSAYPGLYDWIWTVRQMEEEDPSLDDYVLWREVKKQVRYLREELGDGKDDDGKP